MGNSLEKMGGQSPSSSRPGGEAPFKTDEAQLIAAASSTRANNTA
jgi:hypothetical protein